MYHVVNVFDNPARMTVLDGMALHRDQVPE
jgi:hypothetical protein